MSNSYTQQISSFRNTHGVLNLMDRHSMKPFGLFVLLMVLVCQSIGIAEVVDIPDANLRKVLEEPLH